MISDPERPRNLVDRAGDYASDREAMVRLHIAARGVRSPETLDAMRRAPRHLFVPQHQERHAYDDNPLAIGCGQTISQPYIVALMTELAELGPDDRVLEIGTGCGYQTYILALLARRVYTMEIHGPLQEEARLRLEELGADNVRYRLGDGYDGWPEEAPFDAVVVTAAPRSVPEALEKQLGEGGRLVLPVERCRGQQLIVRRREGDTFRERSVIGVRFVPMVRGVAASE